MAREGMTGGGDDAMFGNRCLRAHAQGPPMVVGGAGGGGERKEGGAPAPRSQRPQRLSFLNLSAQERLVCPPPITSNLLLHKDSHFPGPSPLMGTEALEPLKVSISPTWIDLFSSLFKRDLTSFNLLTLPKA